MEKNQANKHIKRGLIWTTINRFSIIIVQFASMIVLARYLTPSDFAMMGIVMFFISISAILTDSGMGASLVGKKDVKPIDYSTLFIYNMGVGIVMYGIFFFFSDAIAQFYDIPELSSVFNIIGLSIVISALGKIQNTILIRELRFKELGIVGIVSSVISLSVAIILAVMGYGVWALVVQNLIQVFLTFVLQFAYNRFIPKLQFSKKSFLEQWTFGVHLFLSLGMRTIYNNVFLALFPKISTLTFSGLYSQASKIQQIPVSIFTEVIDKATFPVLSQIHDEEKFETINRAISRKIYWVAFTVFFLLALLAKSVVFLLLGQKWIEVSPLLTIISFAGIGLTVMAVVRNTLKSMAKTKIIFRLELYKTFIGLFLLCISIPFGDYFILISIVVASLVSSFVAVLTLSRNSNYTIGAQLKDISSALVIIIPNFLVSFVLLYFLDVNYIYSLLIGTSLFVTLTIVTGLVFRNPEIKQLFVFIKNKI